MESAVLSLTREKKMFTNLFRRKAELEKKIIEGIDIVISIIDVMEKEGTEIDPFVMANHLLDLETVFENHEKTVLEMVNHRSYLPACWEELLKISNCTRELVSRFVMVFNKAQIFKSSETYIPFYEYEKKFLFNVKNFLFEYNGNRKYVYQLMINNQHELKDFMKIYFARLNSVYVERIDNSDMKIKLLEIFEQINETNEEIQGAVNKIYIGTSL